MLNRSDGSLGVRTRNLQVGVSTQSPVTGIVIDPNSYTICGFEAGLVTVSARLRPVAKPPYKIELCGNENGCNRD